MKNQQRLMQAEGFYSGKIDGIWGPKTIAAKVKWERSGRYAPAIPNNGFPLSDRGPLPSGVFRKPDGTLTSMKMDQKSEAQQSNNVEASPAPSPAPQAAQPQQVEAAQPQQVEADAPAVEVKKPSHTPNFNKHNQQNQKR